MFNNNNDENKVGEKLILSQKCKVQCNIESIWTVIPILLLKHTVKRPERNNKLLKSYLG